MIRRFLHRFHARPCAALPALVFITACAGSGPPPAATPTPGGGNGTVQFNQLQTEIFNRNCLSAGCHNAQSRAGNLLLVEGASFDNLVGVLPDNPAARNAGLRRVTPFDPERSFLIIKLTQPGAGQGSRMPLGAAPLAPADIRAIREWILAGAPPPILNTPAATPPRTFTPTPDVPTATVGSTASSTATLSPTPSPLGSFTPTPTPSTEPSPTPTFNPDATFQNIQDMVFSPTCLGIGCHNSVDRSGNMVLEPAFAFDNLVGVTPDNPAARSEGLLRVDPGRPENSFILLKLEGPEPRFGSRMPLLGDPLPPEQIQLIRDWITQGALP